jgi:hypothetical protein
LSINHDRHWPASKDGLISRSDKDRGGVRYSGVDSRPVCGGSEPRHCKSEKDRHEKQNHEDFRQRERPRTPRIKVRSSAEEEPEPPMSVAHHVLTLRLPELDAASSRHREARFRSFNISLDIHMRPLCVVLATVLLTSCRDPRAEANVAEAMIQVGTEISAMRQDYATLQNQVDSLRNVVARQDTLLTRLATLANVPLPPR